MYSGQLVKHKSGVIYRITNVSETVSLVNHKMRPRSCYPSWNVPLNTFWLDFRPLTDDEKIALL